MGKRPKKKVLAASPARSGSGSRLSSSSASPSTSSPAESGRLLENGAELDADCAHRPNVEKLRSQLAKSAGIYCLDCAKLRSGASAGKERKGKGKVARKKSGNPSPSPGMFDEKNSPQKLWICLVCGHVGCGGGNSPSTPTPNGGREVNKKDTKQGTVGRGHAWQHWLQLQHPMVMLCGDEYPCWCFLCEVDLDRGRVLEPGNMSPLGPDRELAAEVSTSPSRLMLLEQSAKLIREKLTAQPAIEEFESVEAKVFEDGHNVHAPVELQNCVEEGPDAHQNRRVMKGLINLGNTCFFNSVMQNLLSVELMRNHFGLASPLHEGFLTSSMRKFFQEARGHSQPEVNGSCEKESVVKKSAKDVRGGWSGIDGTYNPKGLFGAICSKAPRFKGFQQQDSHELLRCLLDGLHIEEESARKSSSKPKAAGGEDALRALSKPAAESEGKSLVHNDEDLTGGFQVTEVTLEEDGGEYNQVDAAAEAKGPPARTETFIEQVFGGQLSSTVRCCECGHSSVVFESFLDLSLPIPSKRSSKKVSALPNGSENGSSRLLINRVHPVKGSTANGITDLDFDAFKSTPAGLGTPPLLPPSLSQDCSGSDRGWLDYLNPDNGLDSPDWLDFLAEDRNVDLQACSPNPESQVVLGCTPNLESRKSFSEAPAGSNGNESCQLDSPAKVSELPAELKVEGKLNGAVEHAGNSSMEIESLPNKSFPISGYDNSPLLEAGSGEISQAQNFLSFCKSDSRSITGQEIDFQVQMMGGSDSQPNGLTREAELECDPIVENFIDTSASAEQPWDLSDDTRVHSDIVNGPNGTIILLGPPVQDRLTVTCSDLDGDFDGVGSLFEEENNNDNLLYGPFAPNHGPEFEGPYNEIGFDDVLDLSKVSTEGRGDWLVPNDERQVEENEEVLMSLEGCLQIFTRTELLSGENAWACENCTKNYHERLATSLGKPLGTSSQKHQVKRSIDQDKAESPASSSQKGSGVTKVVREPHENTSEEDGATLEVAGDGNPEDARLGSIYSSNGRQDEEVRCTADLDRKASQETGLCSSLPCGQSVPLTSLGMVASANGVPSGSSVHPLDGIQDGHLGIDRMDEAGQEKLPNDAQNVRDASMCANGGIVSGDLDGEAHLNQGGGISVENFERVAEGDMLENQDPEAEMSPPEQEKRPSLVNSRSSFRTSKLKRSKTRKVSGEVKKVIKQDATKRFLISRAPPVLTIQLKRFAQDMRGRLSKLSGHVTFHEWLDLCPFLDQRHVNFDCKYRLVGTVEHSGTLKSGHYVAFVRGPAAVNASGPKSNGVNSPSGAPSWYYISDSHVHQTNLEAVLQSEAYLVFYERVDMSYDKLHI